MRNDLKIAYEPHPVSPERKAELRRQGFRIVDIEFAPADWIESSMIVESPRELSGDGSNAPDGLPFDGFPSDDELRLAIKNGTGKAPHWKAKRDALIAQYKALQ